MSANLVMFKIRDKGNFLINFQKHSLCLPLLFPKLKQFYSRFVYKYSMIFLGCPGTSSRITPACM